MSEALYVLAIGACAMTDVPDEERIWATVDGIEGCPRIIFWYSAQSVASCAEEAWKRFVDACDAMGIASDDASTEDHYIVVFPEFEAVEYEEVPVWMPR